MEVDAWVEVDAWMEVEAGEGAETKARLRY